jgi:uncharacterized protein (DUF362 family)
MDFLKEDRSMDEKLTRREMLHKIGYAGLAAAGAGFLLSKQAPAWSSPAPAADSTSKVVVAKGGNVYGRLKAVLKACGGIEKYVKKGSKVYIKPNIGWARDPEDAANTNPELIYYLITMCYAAGAKEVKIYENTCDNYVYAFKKSGIKDAVERAKGALFAADSEGFYRDREVPGGKILKKVKAVKYLDEADCFINVPIAKNHSAAKFTLGMKNMMGVIFDRGYWHRSGLDQCIADFMTIVKPQLTIIDGTRILTTGGPKGPGKVEEPKTLIASTDFVAADSYAVTLFGHKGLDIPYIRIAGQMGLGQADIQKVKIEKV